MGGRLIRYAAAISVPVTDQDKAVDFFVGVLGFEKRVDVPLGDHGRWIEVAPEGAQTVISPYTWLDHHDDHVGGFTRIMFECDDLESEYRQLSERGVRFDGPPADLSGKKFVSFQDPFGNVYVLAQT
jgi:catechol 2,3-dioxygenase-like lactoylglutathione lyase family enzyme